MFEVGEGGGGGTVNQFNGLFTFFIDDVISVQKQEVEK